MRLRRSALYLPATNGRALAKARTLDVDMVLLDLEDAVVPERKVEARDLAVAAAGENWERGALLIRANALASEWGKDDLRAIARSGAAGAVVPKVEGPDDLRAADAVLADAPAGFELWAMVETCAAVGDMPAIARVVRETRLAGLIMGWNDLALEMRAVPDPNRAVFQPFLAQAVAAGRAAGLAVLDGVCNAIDDPDRLAAECAQARSFGCDGKTLIHPSQIAACHAAFSPDAAAIAWAERVVAAFAEPGSEGRGVVQVEGRMVELLHLREAQRTLAMAAAIG